MLKRIKDKKGFTLVEVIVVLIIIAMLAVILVPQLTGYIDKANERTILAEAHAAVMACNTLYAEYYAGTSTTFPTAESVAALAELDAKNITLVGKDEMESLTYTKNGKEVTYDYVKHTWSAVTDASE